MYTSAAPSFSRSFGHPAARRTYRSCTKEGGHPYVSASNVPLAGLEGTPRPLTVDEIAEYVRLYAHAAANAVHRAGFDGVELHAANGYIFDQFLHSTTNLRTDAYGGSIKNRMRFTCEVMDSLMQAVGATRVGIRLSPWSQYGGICISVLRVAVCRC